MRDHRNYCNLGLQVFLFLICLSTTPSSLSDARNARHRPSTVLVGTVYCDTKRSHFISGATVSMECNDGAFKAVLKTNKRGNFKLPLKSSIVVKGCQVSLLRSNDPYCATSSIRHHIKQQGSSHVSKAGVFPSKPLKLQQPGVTRSNNGVGSQKNLLGPITSGPFLGLGPILQPVLPQFPPFLGLPNPFQPPSPPSFGFPGGVPGFPGLTPSPPPAFPIPFPPRIPDSPKKTSP